MKNLILETENLSKQYGEQMAVRNVSLQIERGSIYGLLGPNGAGKSTTLKMLVGLLRPTGGRIILDGRPWQRESLSKIGSLIESPALYGNLTAEENLLVHTRLLKIPKTKITEVLETVNLKNTGKKRVSQFSMGMKQRLGIAAALLNDPELLILDEPTNGLDPFGIQELRELIISFSEKGMTVILSSHILSEVAQVADTIGIISGGKLLFQGMPDSDENLENFFTEVILKGGKNCEWTEI
ncbi:lantibiotic protection ABC transporter ATP-binding protein [Blautia sp.]|jgi:gallidermin-class lantibiotic protection ABC transporter ATP-binding subunit|uniref:lantibiotic protection ABC transporter ATP-binding protein n=1 Tax=Blautia sp. TaxID=1955243 RepID=UPI003AB43BF3